MGHQELGFANEFYDFIWRTLILLKARYAEFQSLVWKRQTHGTNSEGFSASLADRLLKLLRQHEVIPDDSRFS